MKITVEHEVSPDKNFCTYGGYFWEKMCASTTRTEIEHMEEKRQ